VPQVASANCVCARPMPRKPQSKTRAIDVNHSRCQPELTGLHGRGRGAIGQQVGLVFFDAVLHIAARAVDLLVEMSRASLVPLESSDDVAWIGLAAGHLGIADDTAFAAPAAERGVA
jgi:hypothetical protein